MMLLRPNSCIKSIFKRTVPNVTHKTIRYTASQAKGDNATTISLVYTVAELL